MRPELLPWALALWLALVLLVPKRSWPEIPARLRAVLMGERRHLYGPPRPASALPGALGRIWGTLPAILEAGAVLYAAGLLAAIQGRPRRLERELRWAGSPAGVLWRLAEGELDVAGAAAKLAELGQPPLREVADHQPRPMVERPPLQWTEDWEREGQAETADSGHGAEEEPAALPAAVPFRPAPGGLRIHTLGGLAIYRGGEDLTAGLMRRKSLAFLFVHLLAHAVLDPGANQYRPSIAEEQAPTLGSSEARAKLRGKLRDIAAFLDGDVAGLVYSDPEFIRLDLSSCTVDVLRLRALAAEAEAAGAILPPDLLGEARAALDDAPGEFLPEFGALQKAANAGSGAAEEVIAQARDWAERARVDLLLAVARAYLALGNPAAAVPYLEEANSRRPELEDVAGRFIEALRLSGQPGRADQLEATYGIRPASRARDARDGGAR
jgi:DNA-binding SARP family transcriptional activator